MEEEIRSYFTTAASKLDKQMKDIVSNAIVESDGGLLLWSIICVRLGDDHAALMIVKPYNTVRGACFASSCVELYKKANSKILQQGKE